MDALKCDSGPFAFYGAAVFGFTRTFFRFYHTSCPRTLKTSEPSQTLLWDVFWILLWQHASIYLTNVRKGVVFLCMCVSFCVSVSFFENIYVCLLHIIRACALHISSPPALPVSVWSRPARLVLALLHFTCLPLCLPSHVLLPSKLTSLLVGFPNWLVWYMMYLDIRNKWDRGTWLLPPCLPSFWCFCLQCLPPRPGKV